MNRTPYPISEQVEREAAETMAMTYDIFVLIAQDPSTGDSTGDKTALAFDSEDEARMRYTQFAKLGNVELIRILRNSNAKVEGAIYYARNFTIPAL